MENKLELEKSAQKEKKAKITFIYEGKPIKIRGSNIFKTKKQK